MNGHLGEQLADEVREYLKCDDEVKLDPQTYARLYTGCYDRPETGYFEGYVFVGEDKRKFFIKYLVRRRMPSNGFDYSFHEPEYECRLVQCDQVFDNRTGEQARSGGTKNDLVEILRRGPADVDELVDSLLSKIEQIQKEYALLASALRKFKETKECSQD